MRGVAAAAEVDKTNLVNPALPPLANASLLYEREAHASGCTGLTRSIFDFTTHFIKKKKFRAAKCASYFTIQYF